MSEVSIKITTFVATGVIAAVSASVFAATDASQLCVSRLMRYVQFKDPDSVKIVGLSGAEWGLVVAAILPKGDRSVSLHASPTQRGRSATQRTSEENTELRNTS
jgi:hypothetical protein